MGVLSEIIAHKRSELADLRRRKLPPWPELRPIDLKRHPGASLRLIAEIKHRSPSAGLLPSALDVAERAAAYEAGGARMVSVLCDERFFAGSYHHLTLARSSTTLPLLCKEFVVDPVQLDCARAYGADAVLLIVRCLDPAALAELHRAAIERGLTPIVEIHDSEELARAIDLGAGHVGVNARDLDTLRMAPERAHQLIGALPEGICRLHFSGITGSPDLARAAASGADGALIGESLMRHPDPATLLRELSAVVPPR